MTILALGINHKTASVDLRERVAFSPDRLASALQEMVQKIAVESAVILSTCNRTELYCNGTSHQSETIVDWLADFHGVSSYDIHSHCYTYRETEAVRHLLRVACGLDSLVLGEPQILGQIKQAYQQAQAAGTLNHTFDRLFQHAFSVAKQVRSETEIGSSAVSVAFAAVNLAKHIFGALEKSQVLLIGAGETIELVATHLKQQGVTEMTVANRTLARAQVVAEAFSAKTIPLAQVPEQLANADIVISSTASTLPIVGKGMVEAALKRRRHRPMFFVDLAVPRDIESQVDELADAYLYTVDDLQAIVTKNIESRRLAATQAEVIVGERVEEFYQWLKSLDGVAMVKNYRQQVEVQKDELLQKARAQLVSGQDPEKVLTEFANRFSNKLMHGPTRAIQQAAREGELELLAEVMQILEISGDRDSS